MKTKTALLVGGGAAVALYMLGRGAVKSMCQQATTPQQLPAELTTIIAQAAGAQTLTPDQMCDLVVSNVPTLKLVAAGAIQFWRPLTPADLA